MTDSAEDRVPLTASVARRLQCLSARAELALEVHQQTQRALLEVVVGICEDAGLSYQEGDQFSVDWRTNTLTLKPRGEGE